MDSQLFADEHFKKFIETLNLKGITQFDYFVNWGKVFKNITPIEKELNLLNTAIGKEDIEAALFDILKTYPKTIKTVPTLLAIRDKSIEVLIDSTAFIYKNFAITHFFLLRWLVNFDAAQICKYPAPSRFFKI